MKKNTEKKGSGWFGLFLAVLAALTIRSCAFEPYNIPSSSMVPSLLIGDYLFISKYPYGYSKHSFPFSIPFVGQGRVFASEPKRGDVVIFKEPRTNRIDYIKRVIGLPGETIEMREGRLYINGELIERKYIGQERHETEQGNMLYTRYTEVLPGGFEHPIYELGDYMQYDTYGPFTIPADHYFMMGDNRDNSADSRYFGPVPAINLEGRAEFIFYSNNGTGYFFEFWKWGDSLRLDRFFTGIK
ncbi:MAG: signal peptidase I [Alphaproteobacteria bacterium]|nr:signal peptidase I [Alphaproteobacteria bacterium]